MSSAWRSRVLVSLLWAPPYVAALWAGGYFLWLLCVVQAVLMAGEFCALVPQSVKKLGGAKKSGELSYRVIQSLTAGAVCAFVASGMGLPVWLIPLWLATQLFWVRDYQVLGQHMAWQILGAMYCGALIGCLPLLRAFEHGFWWAIFAVGVTWFADIGGYVVGKVCGTTALAKRLSPGKTVEGTVGCVMFAMLAGWFWAQQGMVKAPLGIGLCVALAGGMALWGLVGDLLESAFKRAAGVKDAGGLLAGHGGLLDRFDAVLFNLPWLLSLQQITAR